MVRYVVFMCVVAFLVQCDAEVQYDIRNSFNAIDLAKPYSVIGDTATTVASTEQQMEERGQNKSSFRENSFGAHEAFINLYNKITIELSAYTLAFSLATFIPFIWFCVAGAAEELYVGYVPLNFVLFTQTVTYPVTQIFYLSDDATVSVLVIVLIITLYLGFTNPTEYEDYTTYWEALILANILLTNLTALMPLTYTLAYWTLLIVIAMAIYYGFLYVPMNEKKKSAWAVGITSAYGSVSALSCILGIFGVTAALDFVTFFSSASLVPYTNVGNIILSLIWIALVGYCCYIYDLRPKNAESEVLK